MTSRSQLAIHSIASVSSKRRATSSTFPWKHSWTQPPDLEAVTSLKRCVEVALWAWCSSVWLADAVRRYCVKCLNISRSRCASSQNRKCSTHSQQSNPIRRRTCSGNLLRACVTWLWKDGAEYFVFKLTPPSLSLVPTLKAVFPRSKHLFSYRNGLNVAKSSLKVSCKMPLMQQAFLLAKISPKLAEKSILACGVPSPKFNSAQTSEVAFFFSIWAFTCRNFSSTSRFGVERCRSALWGCCVESWRKSEKNIRILRNKS